MTPEAMEWEKLTPGDAIPLAMHGGTASAHVFEKEMIDAIDFAIAARRPLLVRGEPGTGKSQLARAAAKALGRAFVSKVLDVHTEPRDLFWWLDSVERLADAQILGIGEKEHKTRDVRETLDLKHYIEPGPLWWAFDWKSAEFQAKQARRLAPPQPDGGDPARGCVLLLDEIDKADTSVPNGLLEALGAGSFASPIRVVEMTKRPLVIITTNEERELPDAFLRRCLVLHLALPRDETKLVDWLERRGREHFPSMSTVVIREVAQDLAKKRSKLLDRHLAAPGQAEFLDILRALDEIGRRSSGTDVATLQGQRFAAIKGFALNKHPPEQPR